MLIHFYNFVEKIKNSPARRDKTILITLTLAFIINILLWIFLYWQIRKIIDSNPEYTNIPLHYNVFFGIDQYGKWYKIFLIPLAGLVIFLINSVTSFIIYSKKNILSYFLTFITLISQIILALAGTLIILINL